MRVQDRCISHPKVIEQPGKKYQVCFLRDSLTNHRRPVNIDQTSLHSFHCLTGIGPKLGGGTTTLRDWRWHEWFRFWVWNPLVIRPPQLGGYPIDFGVPPWPVNEVLTGGYWAIAGGWVVVDAKCGIPSNAWTLLRFEVASWPSIGPNMKPSVRCVYRCNYDTARRASLPGDGSMLGAPPLQPEGSNSEEAGPPPVFW